MTVDTASVSGLDSLYGVGPVDTGALSDDIHRAENERHWKAVIDNILLGWYSCPESMRDENVIVPSQKVVGTAIQLAERAAKQGVLPPTHVAPDMEGGLAFELRIGKEGLLILRINADTSVEYLSFHSGRLISREIAP